MFITFRGIEYNNITHLFGHHCEYAIQATHI